MAHRFHPPRPLSRPPPPPPGRTPPSPRPAPRTRPAGPQSPLSTPLTPNHFTPNRLRSINPHTHPPPTGAFTPRARLLNRLGGGVPKYAANPGQSRNSGAVCRKLGDCTRVCPAGYARAFVVSPKRLSIPEPPPPTAG